MTGKPSVLQNCLKRLAFDQPSLLRGYWINGLLIVALTVMVLLGWWLGRKRSSIQVRPEQA